MDVITHYDLLIDENNDPFHDPPALQAYMDKWDGQAFLDALKLEKSKNVLEIGIGTGRLAAKAAPHCKRLTGIDISPKTIRRAQENLKEHRNISFICADFSLCNFSETYDIIYSSLTMMHFEDKEAFLRKVAALLNNGGIFCLSIDKNQDTYIDMKTRKVKIYPDSPDRIIPLIHSTAMIIENVMETEHAYIIVSRK